jgi:predicted nucleotidyltransferase
MQNIVETNLNKIIDLCRNNRVKRFFTFGSINTSDFDESNSDIDVIVELDIDNPIDKGETLMRIWDMLEEIFGRKVDLLSTSKVRNPYLQKGINETKKLIYEA